MHELVPRRVYLLAHTHPHTHTYTQVNDTEYEAFYKSTFRAYDTPMAHTHFSLEGQVEFKALLYVPSVVRSFGQSKGMGWCVCVCMCVCTAHPHTNTPTHPPTHPHTHTHTHMEGVVGVWGT